MPRFGRAGRFPVAAFLMKCPSFLDGPAAARHHSPFPPDLLRSALTGAPVHDPHRLPQGPRDLPVGHRPDLRRETEPIAQFAQEPGLGGPVERRPGLDAQDQMVTALGIPIQHDLVLVVQPRLAKKDLLDLARVEVDAFEDDHVVRAAMKAVEADARAPARAPLARSDACDVTGAVADQGQALPREGGHHQLATLAIREDLARSPDR